jgi:hypothetical protein
MMSNVREALRLLQKLDERHDLGDHRYLVIAAETKLGEELGLECTGVVEGRNEDGSPAYYAHDSETCPIHEWVEPSDSIYGREEDE